jgi:hypothetical protein
MSREYTEITFFIGMRLKDRLRDIQWQPVPKRLADLIATLQEQNNKRPHPGPGPTTRGASTSMSLSRIEIGWPRT